MNLLFSPGVYLFIIQWQTRRIPGTFQYLWALYDSLSTRGYVLILGDFNDDLGNSLGNKGNYNPNQRGLKLPDLVTFLNFGAVNWLESCSSPL